MLCVLVNIRFQVLFHSPPGVLFTFPSQYCSTIGHRVVFRLGGWSPLILIGFHVSDDTPDLASPSRNFAYETFTPYGWPSQVIRLSLEVTRCGPHPESISTLGLASSAFARHYSQNLWFDFSSSPYLDVSVRGVPFIKLCIHLMIHGSSPWVFPHSDIYGSLLICSSP